MSIYQPNTINGLIKDSSYSKYFNLYFTYRSAQDLVSGFVYQLVNDEFLYDIEDCSYWIFDVITDFLNGVLILIEDNHPSDGIMSFSYSFHKSFQVYRFCNKAVSDTSYVQLFYESYLNISDPSKWGN